MDTLVTDSPQVAAQILRAGQTVIFPTETVYGLGSNALDPEAARKIYAAKNRPSDNPLIVHIYDFAQINQLARDIPKYAWILIDKFFPGPFTILVFKKSVVPDTTTAGSDKVCLRMPSLPITQEFLKACAVPVAAPSANLSGRPSPTRWEDCLEDMQGRVSAILKGPEATFGLESTIVDCTGDFPVLMRPGSITLEQIAQVVPEVRLLEQIKVSSSTPVLPGSKYRHYSPRAKVSILDMRALPLGFIEPFAFIGLTDPATLFKTLPTLKLVVKDVEEYGHELFAFFRECDRLNLPSIYAEPVVERGLGRALMNRLKRASG